MSSHAWYCPRCAGPFKQGIDVSHLLGTPYQEEKFRKHSSTALVTTGDNKHSVFDSSSTQYYDWCIRETVSKGWLRTDGRGKPVSAVHCPSTGSEIGTLYRWGKAASRPDAIVTAPLVPGYLHAYPEHSSRYSRVRCANCGTQFG